MVEGWLFTYVLSQSTYRLMFLPSNSKCALCVHVFLRVHAKCQSLLSVCQEKMVCVG